jgi:hypothetical protein
MGTNRKRTTNSKEEKNFTVDGKTERIKGKSKESSRMESEKKGKKRRRKRKKEK